MIISNQLKSVTKSAVIVIIIILLMLFLFKKESPVTIPGDKSPITLQEGEKEVIGVVNDKITIVRRESDGKVTQVTKYIPPDGGAKITVNEDGEVEVYVKNKGFTFSPGLGVYYGHDIRIALGSDLVYYNRHTLAVGVGFGKPVIAVPYVAWGYTPDWRWANTALTLGYEFGHSILGGIKVRF